MTLDHNDFLEWTLILVMRATLMFNLHQDFNRKSKWATFKLII